MIDDKNLKVPHEVKEQMAKVASRLKAFGTEDFVNRELSSPSTHFLKASGKLLRPMLVFLGADYIGRPTQEYVNLAASIELLHVSSLIHDDIIDDETGRRGLSAVHRQYSVEEAILAGDALISKAIQEASPYGENVVSAISKTAMEMCAGEVLDHKYFAARSIPAVSEYIKVAELKSSALIARSASIAALHSSDRRSRQLYAFGVALGTAFQIRDDIMDYFDLHNGDKGSDYRLNVVRCLEKERGLKAQAALDDAIRLNQTYIDKAKKQLDDGKNSTIFGICADMLRLEPMKLKASS